MYLLDGLTKEEAYEKIQKLKYKSYGSYALEKYERILKDDISKYDMDDISSRGYVVDTLEAAFWVLLRHNNYKDTIIEAINLGDDTDTVSAIAGSMAGIIYGIDSIPKNWLDTLLKREYLIELAENFEKKVSESK